MPSKDKHVTQADHDRVFWNGFDLDSTPFQDWVVTGIFYEGVHWVEAFLATSGNHSVDHKERMFVVSHNKRLAPIAVGLELLKHESENARYQCYKHTAIDIQQDLIPSIDKIRNHIQSIL